ncbi:DEAD/DEAH box helicase [Amycolatopsis rubida]|uniref:Superfamily II DNA or RNA helicase n=1 Tax=Amycolatopsis rubida TaxID=112413 RepID=A0A1I5W8T1_9PSEU|nr:helicase-related protein [Amycolatopsis rubida]SFQ16160.1 Superfamily II DNA or RNA helicase [Amycolatopsis rubida]
MVDTSDGTVLGTVVELSDLALSTYALSEGRVEEDANGERRIHQGGYGDRQIFELVQNAADEMREPEESGGRIQVVLTDDHLYCANEGRPITPEGAETILRMGVSRKRGGQIGRFGVGVKSVLSVTRAPQFFSRTGAFGFDAEWAREQILSAVNEGRRQKRLPELAALENTPVLRLARPLDVAAERRLDQVLHELLDWAVTVVRLPLLPGASEGLGHDIQQSGRIRGGDLPPREFPHLFQVFSSHVGTLVLEDRRRMPLVRREITVAREGDERIIKEARSGAKPVIERHRVFSRPHRVDDEIRQGAGELHDRVTIDVSWSVPDYRVMTNVQGQTLHTVPNDRGAFWAYFPTTYPTTLSGALNAAWKTNEDRQNLLQSPFNNELLRVAADLVVSSLGELVVDEDPGAYLPLLPGRAKESPNWACTYLTTRIWQEAAIRPSLPDQDGVLRRPADLLIHPEKLKPGTLELWRSHSGRPRDWIHHSVEATRERRGKVTHVLDAAGQEPATIREWLEALVVNGTPAGSAVALKVLAALLEDELLHDHAAAADARQAKILLTEQCEFVSPIAGSVFRRTVEDGLRDDLTYVHRALAEDVSLQRTLGQLGIRDADAEGRFRSVLDQGGFDYYSAESWTRFWELMRTAGKTSQVPAIEKAMPSAQDTLKVRTVAGNWRSIGQCLLTGAVVPEDGSRDAEIAIDPGFHGDDRSVLIEFGAVATPRRGHRPDGETWFDEYHKAVYESYVRKLKPTEHRPATKTVKVEGGPIAGPTSVFLELSKEGRAAFLNAMPDEGLTENWTRQIGKSAATRVAVKSPIRWLLDQYGWVATSKGIVPVRDAVAPQLSVYRDALPVAEISPSKAARLKLPAKVEQVRDAQWADLLQRVKESDDDSFIGRTYALLVRAECSLLREEFSTRCRVGDRWELRPDEDIAIAFSRDDLIELVKENHPALLIDRAEDRDEAEAMISDWGMRRVSDVISKRVRSVPAGSPVAVVDEFPPLRQRFGSRVSGLFLQRCTELEEVVHAPSGTRTTSLRSALHDRTTVLVPEDASFEAVLALADKEFGWKLGVDGCRTLLDVYRKQQEDLELKAKLDAVRNAATVAEKLSLLIDEADLRAGLPPGLLQSELAETGREPDARRVAEMAYNAHDDGVLRVHQKDIQAKFTTTAPSRFDGDQAARRFVASLELPDSFAGARIPAPPARERAEGPVEFPRLHDYQEIIAARIAALLRSPTPRRAMLSLPTAGGKTRTAGEGVITWIRDSGVPDGPILWIAQTGELCEQAVQSWKFVWEKVGPKSELVIDRLWHTNSATPVTDRPHLVVATDAKLTSILGEDQYTWLRQASLVLVDEAHVAISKNYTAIFEKLGLTHRETSRHLIGLTATPYRSNETTTERLVARFGNERLDEGVFEGEPILALQKRGVLSTVEHRQLPGADLQLRPDELAGMMGDGSINFLPKAAEQRLSEDQVRNKILLDEIESLPQDWPVLVFATSVHHAKFLAAKLGDRNIRAAAIDSSTPLSDRRRKIDEFRAGHIRVITNYGVLSQGFDAPATRAVVIARPVYSANSYQQMIGRGLRGPLNGGEDGCLILDVRDNITNFSAALAFTDFEHLWQERRR